MQTLGRWFSHALSIYCLHIFGMFFNIYFFAMNVKLAEEITQSEREKQKREYGGSERTITYVFIATRYFFFIISIHFISSWIQIFDVGFVSNVNERHNLI